MRVLTTTSTLRRRAVPWLAALLLMAGVALAHAQSSDDAGAPPPDRVARLSYVSGDLGLLPAGATDWGDADLNRPLTTGDKLSTGDGARAELELGGGTLRMAGNTDFGMLNLSDELAQVELTHGTLNLDVRRLDQGQSYEIDTPTLALVVTQPGNFRIDVGNDGDGTQVTVFDGQATVYGENNAQRDVLAGRHYQFDDASLGSLMISDIQGEDAFDAWCDQRNQRYAQAPMQRYVPDDMVGAQDLDQYGDWRASPEYGAVWYPRAMPVGWAPYRYGHWAWIAPWGWTWVDDSPWGFAPYHYGRWAMIGGAWGWVPGPVFARPVYAPALVAFVGGGGWSVGIGVGTAPVGWFPLGPGEIYNPWYHVDRNYYQRVNITNIYVHNTYNRTTVINHIDRQYNDYRNGRLPPNLRYANRDSTRGFTAVPGKAFAGGMRVQRDQLRIDPRHLTAAPVLAHGVTTVHPTPASFTPTRRAQARPLPTADFRRDVVARTPPPAALANTRAPFTPAPARPTGAPAARPFTNVRVLNARNNRPDMPRPEDASPRPSLAPAQQPPTTATETPRAPGRRFAPRGEVATPLPSGALPSSRFAHPGTMPDAAPGRRMDDARPPRQEPGNPAQPAMSDRTPTPQHLPQPPRFERAQPQGNPDTAGQMQAGPRYEAPRPAEAAPRYMPPQREPTMPREQQTPRYEAPRQDLPRPAEAAPRYTPPQREPAMPREQQTPRYEAPRQDLPRPAEAAPRYMPAMPREQPMPRYEAPRAPYQAPQRYEPPRPAQQQPRRAEPAPRKAPPKRDDQER